MKYMPIEEFVSGGYLQEINRRLLHPCGLALVVGEDEDSGEKKLWGVWRTDDPEGIVFEEPPDWIKRNRVNEAWNVHVEPRRKLGLQDPYVVSGGGAGVQPCPEIGE